MSTNFRTEGFCVKTAIILQWKCLCVPDCTYIESILINLTQMNLLNIFAMQAIIYQFERDMAAWKRLGCPHHMQWTWWQIVATPFTVNTLSVLMAFQAPVPLSIFRSNSKFDENSERSSSEYNQPITTIFCTRHDSVTVVTCTKFRCDRLGIFETRALPILIKFRIRSKYR